MDRQRPAFMAQGGPDIMNDHAYDPMSGDKARSPDEPDTCRICRGEGTDTDQLFYPCKCSGSIKFVHQGCLMEWLSHSQKKYCELCKTPFRFTKLYDPNMPQELPAPVFLRELFLYCCRYSVTWLRFVLVSFVWLGWLPWSMRAVWRGLFWLADGRWPGSSDVYQNGSVVNQTLSHLAASGTSPASSTLASNGPPTPTTADSMATAIPQFLSPISAILNFTAGEPLIYTVAKSLFSSAFIPATSSTSDPATDPGHTTVSAVRRLRQPSWLSDITFLNKLTPYPTLNNIIIDTLEGQLITLLVVISFILVFLIREWVVQQQPALNIAEGEREAAAQLMAEEPDNRRQAPAANDEPADGARGVEVGEPDPPGVQGHHQGHRPVDTNAPVPAFRPFPEREFHVPDPSSSRPQFPRDSSTASTDFLDATENGPAPADTENDFNMDGAQTLGGLIRGHGVAGNAPFRNINPSDDFWNPRGDGYGAANSFQPENTRSSFSPFPTPAQDVPQPEGPEPRGEKTNDSKEADGYQATLSTPPHSIRPRSPQSRGTPVDGTPGHSHPFSYSLERPEHVFDAPIEPPSPGPSASIPRDDKHSDSGSEHDVEPSEMHREPSEAATSDRPLTPVSLGRAANGPVNNHEEPEAPQEPEVHRDMREQVAHWLWGEIPGPHPQPQQDAEAHDDEGVVEDPAEEAPFVPVHHHDGNVDAAGEDNVAGAEANDADAVDDADDLEGIMELIGMQGPIFGLLQNGVFSALLISFTVAVGIWLPYLWGKIGLVLLTNPVRFLVGVPLTIASLIADIAADTFIGSFAYILYLSNVVFRLLVSQLGTYIPALKKFSASNAVTSASLSLMEGSGQRLKRVVLTFLTFHESDLPMFSVLSHQALRIHETRIAELFRFIVDIGRKVLHDIPLHILSSDERFNLIRQFALSAPAKFQTAGANAVNGLARTFSAILGNINLSYLKTVNGGNGSFALDPELARWDTKDRVMAILVGYTFATVIGLIYLRASAFFYGVNRPQRVNGAVADALRQAGGVIKVVLIIGIEMIVFPLYCGVLLDVALLPLFETATVMSRVNFTVESPLTSLFVHWFVGTCYMFHFALFVSMCRKILRTGVLYFIRDPDDPTFHPVRDVLERSIATQLRKIAFSAFVYGALVIVCLGGVVWGLAVAFKGVLPLHWSSNEPVLEFPVDLLFYNFVVPLAIKTIKPSDTLQKMYEWWFHRCARILRLTNFLFGERKYDEEGRYVNRAWYQSLFAATADVFASLQQETDNSTTANWDQMPAGFVRDGRFVRTPASDQVRVPKGVAVFVEVNEKNERTDGKPDREDGLHGRSNDMFAKIYVPPSFRARISTFIFLIWAFAAVTGVSTTVVPLVLGRKMISSLFPEYVRVNDIYAYSAGVYVCGGLLYAVIYCRQGFNAASQHIRPYARSPRLLLSDIWSVTHHALRLIYAYGTLVLFLPSIFALLSELYIVVPLHTYLHGDRAHVIHFVQDWTLGVLYLRMALRFISWYSASRLALALNAVIRNGWLNPDMRLATRAFIVPAASLALLALLGPLAFGYLLKATLFRQASAAFHSQVYRYCYPAFLLAVVALFVARWLKQQTERLRVSIRDDVYLIGERLHNFRRRRPWTMEVPDE